MLTARDLKMYYPKHDGSADGQALTALQVDTGSTAAEIICDELAGADDTYNDSILLGQTGTNLAGIAAHVKDYAAATTAITLARALAGAPTAGDTFYLIPTGAGCYRSAHEIPGLASTTLSTLTGCAVGHVSPLCGPGVAYVRYDADDDTLELKAPGDANYGAAVDVSGGDGTYTLFSGDEDKCLDMTVTAASLPGSDTTDSVTLSRAEGQLFPHVEGYQSQPGLVRFRGFFLGNANPTDTGHEVRGYLEPRVAAVAATTADVLDDGTAFTVSDGSGLPSRSFWLWNSDDSDYRYIKYRSGNTLYPAAVTWGKLAFDAGGTTPIAVGDTVTGASSGASGVVMAVGVTSGSWAGSNAAGVLYLKTLSGTFSNDEAVQVGGSTRATANGASVRGYRDATLTATWSSGANVAVAPDVDIAVAELAADRLPADLAALTFSAPTSADDGVIIGGGELAAGAMAGICLRQVIVDECYPVDDVVMQMRVRSW